MTYREKYDETVRRLNDAGVAEKELDSRLILEYVCSTAYHDLYVHGDRELTDDEVSRTDELVNARIKRIPLAYLTGTQEFMGLEFRVTHDTLIPRQDTETLVEETLTIIHDGMRFMDLCTGTGCVALSILNYTNETTAVATDISNGALETARENAGRLELDGRIEFFSCDLFPDDHTSESIFEHSAADTSENGAGSRLSSSGKAEKFRFDMIVANPPYINTDVIQELAPEVRLYEPHTALDGGADGLSFYRRIVMGSRDYLLSNGWLLVEIGYDQGDAVATLFREQGYQGVEVIRDLNGKDRVVKGCYIR